MVGNKANKPCRIIVSDPVFPRFPLTGEQRLAPGSMTIQETHDLMERIEGDIREHLPKRLIVTHAETLDDPTSFQHDMLPYQSGQGHSPGNLDILA